MLATPLLREGQAIGAIAIRADGGAAVHRPGRSSSSRLFANQAVIAIENVRLFNELEARNRELTESLEQQTATAEILKRHQQLADRHPAGARRGGEHGRRLCDASDALIFRLDGDRLRQTGAPRHRARSRAAGVGRRVARRPRLGDRTQPSSTGKRSTFTISLLPMRSSIPLGRAYQRRFGPPNRALHAAAARGPSDRDDRDPPDRGPAVLGQADQAAGNVRQPGSDRDRERAPLQRDEGGARASEGLRRGAAGHLELGRGHDSRCSIRSCRAASGCSRAATSASTSSATTARCISRHITVGRDRPGTALPGPAQRRNPDRARRFCSDGSMHYPDVEAPGVPDYARRGGRARRQPFRPVRADAVGGPRHRRDLRRSRHRRRVLREGDRAPEDLRRPGGDRDPERASLQRDEGSTGAPDRDGGDPADDQQLADRHPAGAGRGRQHRRPIVRRLGRPDPSRRR